MDIRGLFIGRPSGAIASLVMERTWTIVRYYVDSGNGYEKVGLDVKKEQI